MPRRFPRSSARQTTRQMVPHAMSTRKRNEWLDAGDASDDDEAGYDSEAEEKSRGRELAGRASKRRKVDDESDVESAEEDDDGADPSLQRKDKPKAATKDDDDDNDAGSPSRDAEPHDDNDAAEYEDDDGNDDPLKPEPKPKKPLTKKKLEKAQKAAKKSGVIYLSRIPPFMKPSAVRSLLSKHGAIGRIFLTPEDPSAAKRRRAAGGNKKKNYVDGWVEFLDKREAKTCVELLNAKIIGGKKGGYYYDDVWNMRYLKGFKWHHLTEQIANENAERASRMRAEIAKTTRENKEYIQNVERAKMLEGMEAKKKKKSAATEARVDSAPSEKDIRRQFKQNEVKSKRARDVPEQPEEVKRVLSKIF